MKRLVVLVVLVLVGGFCWRMMRSSDGSAVDASVRNTVEQDSAAEMTMAEVIARAEAIRAAMEASLDDYTARFVKQERNETGQLSPQTAMDVKIQTRLRGPENNSPMRVFMKFQEPEDKRGRKVIWGEDLYDGKMAVHEVGMILGLKTIYLDPTGMLAMQGQRYPIGEIGIVKLVEKLIERATDDLENPDIKITLVEGHSFQGRTTELLQVRRTKPTEKEDDFSLAEVILDTERNLILQYRSFGWPDDPDQPPPLLESYTYEDVEVNVGLSDAEFDVSNPALGYPSF